MQILLASMVGFHVNCTTTPTVLFESILTAVIPKMYRSLHGLNKENINVRPEQRLHTVFNGLVLKIPECL